MIVKSKLLFFLIILKIISSNFIFAKDIEKDILTVKNKAVPMMGNLKLDLRKKTIIDSSRESNECDIYIIKDMVLESDENIVMLTYDNIFKFNNAGKLLNSLKIALGQGPGEFQQNPSRIFRDSLDNLFIFDGYKLVVFNKELVFKRNIHIVLLPRCGLCVDNKGSLYTIRSEYSNSQVNKVLVKFDENGKSIKKISSFRDTEARRGGGIVLHRSLPYSPNAYYCLNFHNYLIYGNNLEYKLFKYDPDGNLISTFIIDEKPKKISSKEKNEIENMSMRTKVTGIKFNLNLEFPPHRPYFKGILSDEKGRIYVVRMKSVLDKEKDEIIDIFSKDGWYLYQVKLPCFPKIIRNGAIYFIDEEDRDEKGDPIYKIVKLTIKNYDSIKY